VLPSLELLAAPKAIGRAVPSADALQTNASALEGVLGDFGVRGEIINARPGPVVTLYELEPAPGIKSSRVIGLADDIARSMSALSARVAVVAGRNVIGIELPNPTREKVYLREQLASRDYVDSSAKLPLCLGKTIGGDPVIGTSMPEALELLAKDRETKRIVVVGEIGGTTEEETAKHAKRIKKPIYAYVAGRTAPPGKRMGHAGAIISKGMGTAESKIKAFESAGVPVAAYPTEIARLLQTPSEPG